MAHHRFEFEMPVPCEAVFDAFYYYEQRLKWDSLLSEVHVEGGGSCPYVGAVTQNIGRGWMRLLSMQTRFVSYARPSGAAATMVGRAFPFARWSASTKHKPLEGSKSLMIYTYTLETGPDWLRWLMEPVVKRMFDWQTRRRFGRLADYLAAGGNK